MWVVWSGHMFWSGLMNEAFGIDNDPQLSKQDTVIRAFKWKGSMFYVYA